jgi:hypothetical protein
MREIIVMLKMYIAFADEIVVQNMKVWMRVT